MGGYDLYFLVIAKLLNNNYFRLFDFISFHILFLFKTLYVMMTHGPKNGTHFFEIVRPC